MFLNNMSHDIRTPMNAIIGFTSLVASHLDNPRRVKDYLQKISVSSEHLLSLINDVLDMSRIESGKVKIDEQPLHLPDLMHDIRTIVQPTISSKQLKNAPGGYAKYQFIIRDSGIGMKQEFVEHIFDAFAREQTTTVSGILGTGLGMTITKNIVDMMGGTIAVKSQEGIGTEFTVTLTFQRSGEPVAYEKIEQLQGLRVLVADDDTDTCLNISAMLSDIGMCSEWSASGREAVIRAKYAYEIEDEFSAYIVDLSGKKVLLVEDNQLNQEIAATLLEEMGLIVEIVDDGTVAVSKMEKAVPGQYDLILMDIQMPFMDGYEATKEIRKLENPEIAAIPIIAMTANAFSSDQEKAIASGMDGYLTKPIDIKKMKEVLFRTLHQEKKP